MRNMNKWVVDVINNPQRSAMPVMTHPGVEFTGKKVIDVVTDGKSHYEAIKAVSENYPTLAATAVMDLTVEAEAFGANIVFSDDEVPSVTGNILSTHEDVEALNVPDMKAGRLQEYLKANKLASENIEKPFFSGCIGPFSLAGRLYGMTEIMTGCYMEPDTIHLLLDKCTNFLIEWCKALKEQGTNGVLMAEPAAGLLSDDICEEFSSNYVKKVVEAVQDETFILILHNCGNTGQCTEAMIKSGAAGYHFGNAIDMSLALSQCPDNVLVMGNIDPVGCFKMGSPEMMYDVTSKLLIETAQYKNFVVSSGCDTPPGTTSDNINAFFKAIDDFNSQL